MKIIKAILIIFAIPAILYVINTFQDYADAHLTLNTYEEFFMGVLPFLLIGLFIFGIFKAFKPKDKGGDE